MNEIDRIKRNVSNILESLSLAREKSVSYDLARVMEHNGKNDISLEEAEVLLSLQKEIKVPLRLFPSIDFTNVVNSTKLYEEIGRQFGGKMIESFPEYAGSKQVYGHKIVELMALHGCSIKHAQKLLERKVARDMKRYKLSETIAVADILYFKSPRLAKVFESCKDTSTSIEEAVKNGFRTSKEYKTKTINGITLLSETDEGLKDLEEAVEAAYRTGDSQFLQAVSAKAKEKDLFLSDFAWQDKDNAELAFFESRFNYIRMSKKTNPHQVFFHEASHFLDYNIDAVDIKADRYSTQNTVAIALLKKIKEKGSLYSRGMNIKYLSRINAKRYTSNPELRKKWLSIIEEKYTDRKKIKQAMRQKIAYERKKYSWLQQCFSDIYDGLSRGKLSSTFNITGHGKDYYNDFDNVLVEFIAEIGEAYNADGVDVLKFEFGEELASDLITMYETLIKTTFSKELKSDKDYKALRDRLEREEIVKEISKELKMKPAQIEEALNKSEIAKAKKSMSDAEHALTMVEIGIDSPEFALRDIVPEPVKDSFDTKSLENIEHQQISGDNPQFIEISGYPKDGKQR